MPHVCEGCFYRNRHPLRHIGKYGEITIAIWECTIRALGIRMTYKKVIEVRTGHIFEEHDYLTEAGITSCKEKTVIEGVTVPKVPKEAILWK